MTTISIMAIPALLYSGSPTTALRQWTSMYELGRVTTPPSMALSSLVFFYLSYWHYSSSSFSSKREWQLYLLAGSIVGGVLAFTYGGLEKGNHDVLALVKK